MVPGRKSSHARLFLVSAFFLVVAGCGGASGDGGEVHALGEPATVGFNARTDTGERGTDTTLEITVLAVRKGAQEDLTNAGFEVDPEDRSTTSYYVDARYENTGDATVERNLGVSLEDSDGDLIGCEAELDLTSIQEAAQQEPAQKS